MVDDGGAPPERPTTLDVVAITACVAGLAWALVAAFHVAPTFASMFADFGGGTLPWSTQLFLQPWPPLALAALPPLAVAPAIALRAPLSTRRAITVAAVVLTLGAPPLFLGAMYQPIWELAGAVRGD